MCNLTFFDGTRRDMQTGRDSLVTGNRITALPPTGDGPPDASVIDCGGRAMSRA